MKFAEQWDMKSPIACAVRAQERV